VRRGARSTAYAATTLLAVAALTACTAPAPADPTTPAPPSPTPSPSEPIDAEAVVQPVGDAQWARMVAAGMDYEGCPLDQEDLARVEVNHWTFDREVERGVIVVNRDVAASVARIFTRLFEQRYPIRSMRPLEEFDGDSNASLRADNTAAFNCRRPDQINAPQARSPHANGRAIDINPRENPWIDPRCGCWSPTGRNAERVEAPGRILRGDATWEAFADEGWIWQNINVPDYMHFDTGYPSRPRTDLGERIPDSRNTFGSKPWTGTPNPTATPPR
jgi:hypothetical protein